jgi:uncharacterized protein YecE (DUF72 family)
MKCTTPRAAAARSPRPALSPLPAPPKSTCQQKHDPVTERYRYLYDRDELRAWIPSVLETAFNVARVHMTFNNNHANYATTNAAEMADLLVSAD